MSEPSKADLDALWSLATEPNALEERIAELIPQSPDLALQALRAQKTSSNSSGALSAMRLEGPGIAAPWLASRLYTDTPNALWGALAMGVELGRPVRDVLPKGVEEHTLLCLAASSHAKDRALAWDTPGTGAERLAQSVLAARHGDAQAHEHLVAVLRDLSSWSLERYGLDRGYRSEGLRSLTPGELPRGPLREEAYWPEDVGGALVRAAGCVPEARGLLAAFAFDSLGPLVALTVMHMAGEEGNAHFEQVYDSRLGHDPTDLVARLAATLPLAVHDATWRQKAVESARHLREGLQLVRYGWPKDKHWPLIQRLVGEAFLLGGDEDELRHVARWANAYEPELQPLGARARAKLALPALKLKPWDDARCQVALQLEGPEALTEALLDDTTLGQARIISTLKGALGDYPDTLRIELIKGCRHWLERIENIWISSVGSASEPAYTALKYLSQQSKGEMTRLLEGSTSPWIQHLILGDGEMPRPERSEMPEKPWPARQLDNAPWHIGRKINGMALSPNGEKLALAGEGLLCLVDVNDGETIDPFEIYGWVYDCAFSPDGRQLAICCHGGHVWIMDVASKKQVKTLKGHSGVPNGVRAIAWGEAGLFTGGEDGRLICWDVKKGKPQWVHHPGEGSYQDIAFLPDSRLLLAHAKKSRGSKSWVEIYDPETETSERVNKRDGVWAVAVRADGAALFAGEGANITVCRPGTLKKKSLLPAAGVTRLQFDASGGLWAATEKAGLIHFAADGTSTEYADASGTLWAMAMTPDGEQVYAAGGAGVVQVIRDGVHQIPEAATIRTRIMAALEHPDGDVIAVGWHGQIVRWPAAGGDGVLVRDVSGLVESMALWGAEHLVVGTRTSLRLIRLSDGELVGESEGRADAIAVLDDRVACGDGSELRWVSLPDMTTQHSVQTNRLNSLCPASEGGVFAGNEAGWVMHFDTDGARPWVFKGHGADKYEEGNPHANVCSIDWHPELGVFVTGATDHTVRVWDIETQTLRWRISTGFGLFNRLAVSEDGLLAVPGDHWLAIYDIKTGELVGSMGAQRLKGNAISTVTWLADGALLVLTHTGRVFRAERP
ncbi:MAG: WD40 repeat domain-containing protein [Bradymonadia bacterium]